MHASETPAHGQQIITVCTFGQQGISNLSCSPINAKFVGNYPSLRRSPLYFRNSHDKLYVYIFIHKGYNRYVVKKEER